MHVESTWCMACTEWWVNLIHIMLQGCEPAWCMLQSSEPLEYLVSHGKSHRNIYVDPNLSSEERRSMDLESDQGDWGSDNEGESQGQWNQSRGRGWLRSKFSLYSSYCAVHTLIQKKKSIVSHDSFLSKLQCFASDAVGLLIYLLGELQVGRDVPKERAISALQTINHLPVGQCLCHLVGGMQEVCDSVLQQLNHQLFPLAEKEYEHKGILFGDAWLQSESKGSDGYKLVPLNCKVLSLFPARQPLLLHAAHSDKALGVVKKVQQAGSHHTPQKVQSGGGQASRACLTPSTTAPRQELTSSSSWLAVEAFTRRRSNLNVRI